MYRIWIRLVRTVVAIDFEFFEIRQRLKHGHLPLVFHLHRVVLPIILFDERLTIHHLAA